jgi:hypothetical protein
MSRNANKVTVQINGADSLISLLERLPKLVVMAGGPMDRAVRKASTIVAARARQLAPDSSKTGSRDKQSKKTKAKWGSKIKRTIKTKLIKYEKSVLGIIGPKSPEGNAAHFMQEKPRRHVLWGKATMIKQFRIEKNWITKAFDDTKNQQMSAMEASLKADIDANMRS